MGGPKGGKALELDYPDDTAANGQRNTTYTGAGGVPIGSTWSRLLYAVKLREQNLLLSDGINADSRILYDRTPRERVAKVAPYLTLDQRRVPRRRRRADRLDRRRLHHLGPLPVLDAAC